MKKVMLLFLALGQLQMSFAQSHDPGEESMDLLAHRKGLNMKNTVRLNIRL